jgi:hypothetical protein
MNAQIPEISEEELARRRAAAHRMAWAIGAAVLALYVIGFFFKRG